MSKSYKNIFKYAGMLLVIFAFTFSLLLLPAGKFIYSDQTQIKVFIDPGHGGYDPGAVANGLLEKNANLAIALKLKSKLEASGFAVIMRRTDDQYKTLDEIVGMANSSGADIFISIHNNASISSAAHGTETYWSSNGVNGSNQLANLVQSKLVNQIGRADRGVKTANFRVIKYTNMPAVLVECAFVSNPEEAELIKTDSFQEKCATGLFEAINKFSEGINKETGYYVDNSGANSSGFTMYIDYPRSGSVYSSNFSIWGWAADTNNTESTGVSKIEVFDGPDRNENTYLGSASTYERTQLAAEWENPALVNSGFTLTVDTDKLSKGEHNIYVYAYDYNNNHSFTSIKVNIVKPDEEPQDEDAESSDSGSEEGSKESTEDGEQDSGSDENEDSDESQDSEDSDSSSGDDTGNSGESQDDSNVEEDENSEGEGQQAENAIPVADPGGPYEAEVDEGISFNGSASIDSDGQILEYNWDFGDDTTGSGVNPNHFYTVAGQYSVTLVVKDDNEELSEVAATDVTITEASSEEEAAADGEATGQTDEQNQEEEEDPPEPLPYNTYTGGSNAAGFTMYIDYPVNDSTRSSDFTICGWAADINNTISTGVKQIDVHDGSDRGTGSFLGTAGKYQRVKLAEDWENPALKDSGYYLTIDISRLSAGEHILYVYAYNSGWDYTVRTIKVNIIKSYGSGDSSEDGEQDSGADDGNNEEDENSEGEGQQAENAIPVADPGGPYEAEVDEGITFNGSASADSDGQITEYSWDFGDDTTGSGVSPTHSYTEVGVYSVTLAVKDDNEELSEVASTTATITEASSEEEAAADGEATGQTDEQDQEEDSGSSDDGAGDSGETGDNDVISNSTSVVGYTEVTVDQLVQIFVNRNSNKVEWARRLAALYIQYGQYFNIRADIAWVQMCHETGFLEYTGDVQPDQNNFAGIGATGGIPGNSFGNEELGVIAHYAHLSWYYYADHVNEYCNSQYDPRHFGSTHYKYTGDTTLNHLNGRWAPGSTYTNKIILFANDIYGN